MAQPWREIKSKFKKKEVNMESKYQSVVNELLSHVKNNPNKNKIEDIIDIDKFGTWVIREELDSLLYAAAYKNKWKSFNSRSYNSDISNISITSLLEKIEVFAIANRTDMIRFAFKNKDNNFGQMTLYEEDGGSLSINFGVGGENLERLEEIYEEIKNYITTEKAEDQYYFYVLLNGPEGYYFSRRALPVVNLVESNYTKEVVLGIDKSINCLKADNPSGKIVIMEGPPGTGKSYAIRHIIKQLSKETRVIALPVDLVPDLSGPNLMNTLIDFSSGHTTLTKSSKFCIVIEDADRIINCNDNASISAILNMGDGLIGETLDSRLILTTNLKRTEINKAIIRPGRLAAYIEFKELSAFDATNCAKELGFGKIYTEATSLATIYADMNDGTIYKQKEKEVVGQYL